MPARLSPIPPFIPLIPVLLPPRMRGETGGLEVEELAKLGHRVLRLGDRVSDGARVLVDLLRVRCAAEQEVVRRWSARVSRSKSSLRSSFSTGRRDPRPDQSARCLRGMTLVCCSESGT